MRTFELTKDQIKSYSATLLSGTIPKSFDFRNEHNSVTLTVAAAVDDGKLQRQIDEQQNKVPKFEEAVKRSTSQV